mmetsp:Transcript_12725/g.40949  ORF Transcript_12725/g.40949 Transcript_12725/m.40949 type:complete len:236 (-) Transcript_12725:95-802(-)
MSGRAMNGESQRGLKKMKPLSLAPLSLGGDQLEPGDAMIDAMIDKLLHFGADASASPVTPRAAGRFGLARAGGAAISQRDVAALLRAAKAAFLAEPMLLEIAAPVKLVGDIHGQYADLLRVFDECGGPGDVRYLFLGDYVDRGAHGLECALLLLCYKVKHGGAFWLLRGNHECAAINRIYGFCDECKRAYGLKVWKQFNDVFNCMPVAAVVDAKIFCVHGGLSPELRSAAASTRG